MAHWFHQKPQLKSLQVSFVANKYHLAISNQHLVHHSHLKLAQQQHQPLDLIH